MAATDEINIVLKFMEATLTSINCEHISSINTSVHVHSPGQNVACYNIYMWQEKHRLPVSKTNRALSCFSSFIAVHVRENIATSSCTVFLANHFTHAATRL